MLYHILITLLSLASIASSTIPTLYLVGDGTMSKYRNEDPAKGYVAPMRPCVNQ